MAAVAGGGGGAAGAGAELFGSGSSTLLSWSRNAVSC